jgi:hypothetical protein
MSKSASKSSKSAKKSKLQEAASKRLQTLAAPKITPEQFAHAMFHAEERGEVQRVPLEDGSWAWALPVDKSGKRPIVKPTAEMLAALHQFETDPSSHNH